MTAIKCFVYKSERKQDHFLFLPKSLEEILQSESQDRSLPPGLLTLLGALELVIEFELTPEKQLAQADAKQVIEDIRTQGYYLQMPKTSTTELENKYFN